LVLEQHDVAGGCTHTFEENGYEFDTGLHYGNSVGSNLFLRPEFPLVSYSLACLPARAGQSGIYLAHC